MNDSFPWFPFGFEKRELENMSEDETKDYLMVQKVLSLVVGLLADSNHRLSNTNLHLNSLCIYCFIIISMAKKRRSRPWQFLVKAYSQGEDKTTHIEKTIHYQPSPSVKYVTTIISQGEIYQDTYTVKNICIVLWFSNIFSYYYIVALKWYNNFNDT